MLRCSSSITAPLAAATALTATRRGSCLGRKRLTWASTLGSAPFSSDGGASLSRSTSTASRLPSVRSNDEPFIVCQVRRPRGVFCPAAVSLAAARWRWIAAAMPAWPPL